MLQHPSLLQRLPKADRACVLLLVRQIQTVKYCDCIRPAGFVFVNSAACRDRLLHTSRCPLTANYQACNSLLHFIPKEQHWCYFVSLSLSATNLYKPKPKTYLACWCGARGVLSNDLRALLIHNLFRRMVVISVFNAL